MTCEEARALLPDLALASLSDDEERAVRKHLRGCGSCRAEAAALDEGVFAFAIAGPVADPPEVLQGQVIGALREEWADAAPVPPPMMPGPVWRRRLAAGIAAAAVVVAVLALGWGVVQHRQVDQLAARGEHLQEEAEKYETFLGVLGGENVRVGPVEPSAGAPIEGSVVVYDSRVGQNWVLALVRAPGMEGRAILVLQGGNERVRLHPMELNRGGEASAWLVTPDDLRAYDRFTMLRPGGDVIGTGRLD